ncbi:MAG: cell division protein FtsA, partial [Cyclobacteriaceae bacterium]|nr:cell division protein FtsA [Cyclobacteriaceae bacterium HetDA_MAG_MS6]
MQEDKIIVGLDIGTTKICAIVGRKNEFGKLEILGMGKATSEGVIRGIVTNIDKTVHAIEKAITEASEQSGIDINVVNVGIAGQHIKSSVHHGSITRDSNDEISVEDVNRLTNDMYRIVIPPGSEIIHVMPQDYIVDYEDGIKDPVGMSGVKLEADFHIITAQNNAINNINKCVRRAGLEIENLILEPLASSLAVLSDEEKEAGVCLVDIGGGTTDIAVFYDN